MKDDKMLFYLKDYFFNVVMPLLGFPESIIKQKKEIIEIINDKSIINFSSNKTIHVEEDGVNIKIYVGLVFLKRYLFYIEFKENDITNEQIVIANHLVYSFSTLLESNEILFSEEGDIHIKQYLLDKKIKTKYINLLYDYAVQKGICDWIMPKKSMSSLKIEKLIEVLEKWSQKTYEGHRVCYGILINNSDTGHVNNEKEFVNDFIDFLEDEYSAVISDGISSIIEVDSECNYVKYHSIYEDNKICECNLDDNILPYRFAQIISTYVEKEKIGIFLLQNGDIIIAKSKMIYFIKRNGKWINFKFDTFKKIMNSRMKVTKQNTKDFNKLLENIFSTTLDVSLAHSGGIIAVVNYKKNIKKLEKIINRVDNLYKNDSLSNIYSNEIAKTENAKKELKKKITKRKVILDLLKEYNEENTTNNILFNKIDRKLRAELVGLDGACILDLSGNVISFGAIIQNDPGSSGGGRGAAAKKLSQFSGFAIKISTDGYIEVYVDEEKIYSIK